MTRFDGRHLSDAISAETGLGFVGSEGNVAGVRWFELSPEGHSPAQTFIIRLEVGWRRIDASFRLGKFARDLLLAMRESDESGRRSFASVLDACASAGAELVVKVNGETRNHRDGALWQTPWRSFGFSMSKGMLAINEGDYETDAGLIEEWAARTAAAALSLMPVETEAEENKETLGLPEGGTMRIEVNRYERDRRNRAAALAIHGVACQACGIEMGKKYGRAASGMIEVHHVVPISKLGRGYIIDPARDLVPMCPNRHSVAHRRSPPYSVEEIRDMVRENQESQRDNQRGEATD